MNQELRKILPLFDHSEIVSVNHLGTIPAGAHRQETPITNIKGLRIVGKQGAIVSTMKKDNNLYMVIVNKDYKSKLQIHIKALSSVRRVTKELKEEALRNTYSIDGGDLLVFRLK